MTISAYLPICCRISIEKTLKKSYNKAVFNKLWYATIAYFLNFYSSGVTQNEKSSCNYGQRQRFPNSVKAEFAHSAKDNGFGVIIAAAGMAAHLAGVLAAHTTLPVIGIPVKSANLDGLDALLATAQMPTGIPVATVAIDGAGNAGILAVQMLALSDGELADKLDKMKEEMREAVYAKDKAIAEKAAQL